MRGVGSRSIFVARRDAVYQLLDVKRRAACQPPAIRPGPFDALIKAFSSQDNVGSAEIALTIDSPGLIHSEVGMVRASVGSCSVDVLRRGRNYPCCATVRGTIGTAIPECRSSDLLITLPLLSLHVSPIVSLFFCVVLLPPWFLVGSW